MKSLHPLITIVAALGMLSCAASAKSDSKGSELVQTEVLVVEQASNKRKKGGGSSSIGTDAYDVRTKTTWFYGKRPVVTCFNHIESFGPPAQVVSKAVESAIKRWQDYFAAKRIGQGQADLMPNVNFKFIGRCKGDEDLVFFFGTGPIFAGLADLKAVQRLGFPVAYVNKTHIARDMKWSKGYLRFVSNGYYEAGEKPFPNWNRPGALEAVLTHELGHVLGFGHAAHTIMRSELVDQAFSDGPLPVSPEIDGSKELVSCTECPDTYLLEQGSGNGDFFAKIGLKTGSTLKLLKAASGFKLTDGKVHLPVTETSRTELDNERTLWSNFSESLNATSQTINLYGFVTSQGQSVPLIIEYNSGAHNGAIVLRSALSGEIREIGRFRRE